ncbi:MAG: hypothetical protein AB1758_07555 [Candidatus Eremiobacterota bacterium]
MRRGMSLAELILTATLLALIFIFLLNILPTTMMSIRQAEHRIRASAVAQAILDECASGPFRDLQANATYIPGSPGPLGAMLGRQDLRMDDGVVLQPTLEVSAGAAGVPRDRLARVRVIVTWQERGRQLRVIRELKISCLQR